MKGIIMIYKNVDFHNIDELYNHGGVEGVLLGRIPDTLVKKLSIGGQMMMVCPSGSEIRFVSDTYPVRITLSLDKMAKKLGDGIVTEARIFFGTFQTLQRFVISLQKTTLEIVMPPDFIKMAEKVAVGAPFSPHVCRVRLWGTTTGSPVRFHNITTKGNLRPPKAEELPKLRYLAYGTSLTQGFYASEPQLTYINLVGCSMGADVINRGTSCSAYCEPEMADYIAGRSDWDFATLDLSLNMVGVFSPEKFSERVTYMINKVAGSNRKRPVVCITIKPYIGDYIAMKKKPEIYRRLLREAVAASSLDNVYLVEGPELMPDVAGGFAPDMVHLGDYGMIQIAQNLAEKLKPILQSRGLLD